MTEEPSGVSGIGSSRVFIVRHCSTEWSLQRRLQGKVDQPLSPEGFEEAREMADRLAGQGIQRIVTSPLRRAYSTAVVCGTRLGVSVEIVNGLRELDHGDWEGCLIEDLIGDPGSGFSRWLENPCQIPIPGGGETVEEAIGRVRNALRHSILEQPGGSLLAVTHKHIRALLECSLEGLILTHFGSRIRETTKLEPLNQACLSRLMEAIEF